MNIPDLAIESPENNGIELNHRDLIVTFTSNTNPNRKDKLGWFPVLNLKRSDSKSKSKFLVKDNFSPVKTMVVIIKFLKSVKKGFNR